MSRCSGHTGTGSGDTTRRGVEGIHTPAAGVHHIRYEAGAVAANVLHDTAVGVHVRELLLHVPPLQPLQRSGAGQGCQGVLPEPLHPPHPRQAEQSPPHKSPSSGRTGTPGSDHSAPFPRRETPPSSQPIRNITKGSTHWKASLLCVGVVLAVDIL